METILVTGGTGLVGKAIEKVTKEVRNLEIIFLSSKDCDLTDYSKTNELFEKIKPDYVIHLAACVGGLFKNLNSKVEMFEKNTEINLNVLKCCHKFNVKKCISCLSTCIFPDKTSSPSLSSYASYAPVEAPDGTEALPKLLSSKRTSTSTVGLPLLSNICLPKIFLIFDIENFLLHLIIFFY